MPIYMEFEGVKGSVTSDGYKAWIELQSCQLGVNRHVTSTAGRGTNREASTPSVSEIVVTKDQDSASTGLYRESLSGTGKKVKIDFVKTGDKKMEPFLKLELENTLVSSFSFSGHGGPSASPPMESLSLNFTKIVWNHIVPDDKNKAGSPNLATFDLATGKTS